MADATIITARLDDSELKKSIDNLVDNLAKGTERMRSDVDETVNYIQKSFKKIGDMTFGINTKSITDLSKEMASNFDAVSQAIQRAANQPNIFKTQKQAIEEFNNEYKQSVEKARQEQARLNQIIEMGRKSAEQSMRPRERWSARQDSELDQTRMKIHELQRELKTLDAANINMQQQAWDSLSGKIWHAEMQIARYRKEQERLRQTPASDANEQRALTQQFEALNKKIVEAQNNIKRLEQEQLKVSQTDFVSGRRAELTQQLEDARNRIRQMGQEMERFAAIEQQAAQAAQQIMASKKGRGQGGSAYYTAGDGQRILLQFKNEEDLRNQILKIEQGITNERRKQASTAQQTTSQEQRQAVASNLLRKEFEDVMGIKAANDKVAELQDKLKELEIILSKVEGKNIISPERIKAAEEEVTRLNKRIGELFEAEKQLDGARSSVPKTRSAASQAMTFADYGDLQSAVAAVLRLSRSQVQINDTTEASYNALQKTIKQLTTAYNQLTEEQRRSENGKTLIDQIQRARNAARELQQELNRPVSKDAVFGLREDTLDRIAYKLQQLNTYKRGIDISPTNKNAVKEMQDVDREISRLQQNYNKLMSTNAQMIGSNNALARSWNYMKNRLAFYFTVGASTQFVKQLIEVRGQYEMTEKALGILVDSAERGSQIFNQLSQMALVSPYTLIELSNAAKQLTAYGIEAGEVVDTTRRLADISSAVGAPIERIAYALGHVQSFGYLTSLQARQFANAGIPLVKILADRYTELEGKIVSVTDVYDRMKKKQVTYADVMNVVNEMTDEGGRFFDFQAKMADTLRVQLANLNLAWMNMLNDIGASNQSLISYPIAGLKELFLHWKSINDIIRSLLISFGLFKAAQFAYYAWVATAEKKHGAAVAARLVFGQKLVNLVQNLKSSIVALFANPWTWVFVGIAAITDMATSLYNANEAVEEFNKSIANVGKERFESIDKFLANFDKTDTTDLQRAWDSIRDEIEKSSAASGVFIAKLEQTRDLSERIEQGLGYLKQLQEVQGVISQLGTDEIKVNQTLWHGLFGEGLMDDFDDFFKSSKKVVETFGSIKDARDELFSYTKNSVFKDYTEDSEEFRKELDALAVSLENVSNKYNLSPLQQRELMETNVQKLTEGKSEEEIFKFRYELEQRLTNGYKAEIDKRIAYAQQTGDKEREERLRAEKASWLEQFGEQKSLSEQFFKFLSATQRTSTEDMFRGMSAEEIKTQDFSQGRWKAWAEKIAKEFSTKYQVAFDDLWKLVQNANLWSVMIPVYFKTIGQPVSDILQDYKTRTGKDAKGEIANAKSQVEIIKQLQDEQEKLEEQIKTAQTAGGEYFDKNKEKWQEQNNELIKDIHAYNALTKAEEKAAKASNKRTGGGRKGAKPEDEVAKALKDELSIIKEMQSNYDKLRKAGVNNIDAMKLAAQGYEATLKRVNNVLTKYGIDKFNASAFAGKNVKELLDTLTRQREALIASGKVKTTSLKDLDIEIQKLTIDAKTYDFKKITDGLHNELSKLKEEYELAIELDADPDLGGLFSNMFNIDTMNMPQTIDEYMDRVQDEFDKRRKKLNYGAAPFDVFTASDKDWADWGRTIGLTGEALDNFKADFVDAQNVVKDWAKDVVKQTRDLEYKLGDLNKKIEIEKAKLATLEQERMKETNAAQQHLLDLQIQAQKEAIEKLKMESIKLMPFYEELFGDLYNLSIGRLKQIVRAAKEVMQPRKDGSGIGYEQRTNEKGKTVYDIYSKDRDGNIKKSTVTLEEYIRIMKQITHVEDEIAKKSPWEKIKDSFSRDANGKLKNFGSGMETIGSEVQKVANIVKEFGSIFDALGADDDTKEAINDIAESIEGVGTAAQGIGQMASGDYIGGALNTVKGLWQTVSSWFDNGNKRIDRKVKDSERTVSRLANAYKDLERAVEKSMGSAEIQARKAAIANKQLQLTELERQLDLEKSRKKKNQDEDKIISLEGEIIDARNEIADMTQDIANTLFGSDIKSAAEDFVNTWVQAWRAGEDTMDALNGKFDDMIDNMILKAIASKVVAMRLKPIFDMLDTITGEESDTEMLAKLRQVAELAKGGDIGESINQWLTTIYGALGIGYGSGNANKNLSALQQGIQSITEDTAGALEAYMNSVSQQVYLHSELLTQIRDAVVMIDSDSQIGIQAQMLLQLQQSYAIQVAIQGILLGWSNPSGMAMRVELTN